MKDSHCPPDDTDNRQRSRYFEGKLLTAEDFEREQDYHRATLRRHNLGLHGWGVARGFDVTPSSSGVAEVVVAPGYAIDPCRREILLTDAVTIPLPASGASTIAVRAVETAVGDNVLRDDVEVTIVSDPLPPWIVLASVETEGAGVRVEMSVRRRLSLD